MKLAHFFDLYVAVLKNNYPAITQQQLDTALHQLQYRLRTGKDEKRS